MIASLPRGSRFGYALKVTYTFACDNWSAWMPVLAEQLLSEGAPLAIKARI